jgi:hypothetical protein
VWLDKLCRLSVNIGPNPTGVAQSLVDVHLEGGNTISAMNNLLKISAVVLVVVYSPL